MDQCLSEGSDGEVESDNPNVKQMVWEHTRHKASCYHNIL